VIRIIVVHMGEEGEDTKVKEEGGDIMETEVVDHMTAIEGIVVMIVTEEGEHTRTTEEDGGTTVAEEGEGTKATGEGEHTRTTEEDGTTDTREEGKGLKEKERAIVTAGTGIEEAEDQAVQS
jgi:hypothetical protein